MIKHPIQLRFIQAALAFIFVLVLPEITFASAWDPNAADSKIREFFAIVVGIIGLIKVSKFYNEGKNGSAIMAFLIGAAIVVIVLDANILKSFGNFFKNLLGF